MDGIATGRNLVRTQRVYLNSQQRTNKGQGTTPYGDTMADCEFSINHGLITCHDDEVLSVALVHFGCSSSMLMFGPDPVDLYMMLGVTVSTGQICKITLNSTSTNMVYRGITNEAFCALLTANLPTTDIVGTAVIFPVGLDFGVMPNTNLNTPKNCNWLCDLGGVTGGVTTEYHISFMTPGEFKFGAPSTPLVTYPGTNPLFASAIGLPNGSKRPLFDVQVSHNENIYHPYFVRLNQPTLNPNDNSTFEGGSLSGTRQGTLLAPMNLSSPSHLILTTNFPTESYCPPLLGGNVLASVPMIANKINYDTTLEEWNYNFLYTNTALVGAHKPVGSINPSMIKIGLRLEDGTRAHLAGHDYDLCLEFKTLARDKDSK